MSPRRVVPLVAALLAAGCGETAEVELPSDLARKGPPPDAFAKPLGAALETEPARESEDYLRAFATSFSSMTPENALKWETVHPEPGEFDFQSADELVGVARGTGKRVRGHTLVWDRQLPAWVAEGDWTRSELAAVLREHIETVMRHYRGRVAEWDVVNEPLDADGRWTKNVFYRSLGPKYVDIAFRAAHEADPEAFLFLNENGAELPGRKWRALLGLTRDLVRRGVPIHGVGFENHASVLVFPRKRELAARFRALAELGLGAAITEMDVVIPPHKGVPDALGRQARAYGEAARACVEAPNCTGLTVWGVTDEYSWLGEDERPLPFNADGHPKPALWALFQALGRPR